MGRSYDIFLTALERAEARMKRSPMRRRRKISVCAICATDFVARWPNQPTCSRKCGAAYRTARQAERTVTLSPEVREAARQASRDILRAVPIDQRGPMCAHCKVRPVAPTDSKGRARTFCSQRHYFDWLRAQMPPCPICGKPIYQRKYATCSHACGYEWRRRQFGEQIACGTCGTKFWPTRSIRGRKKFCSKACSGKAHTGDKHHNRRPGGPISGKSRGLGWPRLSLEIRQRDRVCRRCGHPDGPFDVDHIVPWRYLLDKELANSHTNLATLCGRCHAIKTHRIEKRLALGHIDGMNAYIKILARTGPVPSSEMLAAAYVRLRELQA